MDLIATHNSGTGEPSKNWLYSLMAPVAKCQFRSIAHQYGFGCTYFDIRVRKNTRTGKYYLCHGLWKSKTSLDDVMITLTTQSLCSPVKPKVSLFYEGSFTSAESMRQFIDDMMHIKDDYKGIDVIEIGVKKPEWTSLKRFSSIPCIQDYAKIVGLKVLFPFPILHWAFRRLPEFNDTQYTMVDFL